MNVHNLDSVFRPRRIALFGANENPGSVGCTVLRNIIAGGYRGVVYPVHPSLEAVHGVHCYSLLRDLPNRADLAVICSAAQMVPDIVRRCGEAGIRGVIILSAGFREAGPSGRALEDQVRDEARRFETMRIVGPNCLGVIVPELRLNVSFAAEMPRTGRVALISQSGALGTAMLDRALDERIGFSHFVSVGNALDVDFGDLIDYFGEDGTTESILLYMESLRSTRRFMTAARAFARVKPIVAYKAGRFTESAKVAGSHTGAMAGEDDVYDAAFRRAGIVRVFEIDQIFDCAGLLARRRVPRGPRLGMVTNAGGPGVMAVDALLARRGELAELSSETMTALDQSLPPAWSHGNPVDVLGDARPKRFAKAAEAVLRDEEVDALLAILTPQAMSKPTAAAKELGRLAAESHKPVLAAWIGGESMREGRRLLNQAGIATYETPERAVAAFMTLVTYARNLEALHETPRELALSFPMQLGDRSRRVQEKLPGEGRIRSESVSKDVLASYGIPVAPARPANTVDEAVEAAEAIGYPVVLKIRAAGVTHKSDVGGVALDLRTREEVRREFGRMVSSLSEVQPDSTVQGVTVQPMVSRENGVEMILGAKQDPAFGAVIVAGTGGVNAELWNDRAIELPPLNESLARKMLESLRSWPLLQGFRGRPKIDVPKLIEAMVRVSYLVAEHPEIAELDINPLLATAEGVVALDARVIVAPSAKKPFAHLALRPYPEEFTREVELADGTPAVLRPIRPEDEPLWIQLIDGCSRESLFARFGHMGHFATHETAIRYCFNDYDRELALVVDLEEAGKRKLAGVGRLVSDPDHKTAEYAILIGDRWQNRGLGHLLTSRCLEIADSWGVREVVAQTDHGNRRMVKIFSEMGFQIEDDGDVVECRLPLDNRP